MEQEFYVYRGEQPVDFRELVHTLGIDGARIDPGDRNAYRLADGSLLTADGTEAEFATVPIETAPGFALGLAALCDELHERLTSLLPGETKLYGASTHINVSVPGSMADRLVLEYPSVFGPALQALWDRPWGEGLMIRPRSGRVEFGGEFISGSRLAVVALFCCASVRALAGGLGGGLPTFRPRIEPTTERLGIQFRRDAFGTRFYEMRRTALLASSQGPISLQDAVDRAVTACAAPLNAMALPGDLALLEGIARGTLPLGLEEGRLPREDAEAVRVRRSFVATPLGGISTPAGITMRPKFDTWDYTLFEVRREDRAWWVSVPRPSMGEFLIAAKAGRLDHIEQPWRAPLERRSQLFRPNLFSHIADYSILAPAERAPGERWLSQPNRPVAQERAPSPLARASVVRPGKFSLVVPPEPGSERPEDPPASTSEEARKRTVNWIAIAIGAVVIVLAGLGGVRALGGGGSPRQQEPASGAGETPPGAGASTSPSAGQSSPVAQATTPPSTRSETVPAGSSPPGETVPAGETTVAAGSPGAALSPTPTPTPTPTTTPTSGAGNGGTQPTPTNTPVTPAASATSPPPVLSGNRTTTFAVSANPGNHPCGVGPTLEVNFFIVRAGPPEPGVEITLTVSGPGLPTMVGNKVFGQGFDSQGGSAVVSGTGQYCGFTTSYVMSFTITPGGIAGTLVIGGDGALPGGQAITFNFSGGPPH